MVGGGNDHGASHRASGGGSSCNYWSAKNSTAGLWADSHVSRRGVSPAYTQARSIKGEGAAFLAASRPAPTRRTTHLSRRYTRGCPPRKSFQPSHTARCTSTASAPSTRGRTRWTSTPAGLRGLRTSIRRCPTSSESAAGSGITRAVATCAVANAGSASPISGRLSWASDSRAFDWMRPSTCSQTVRLSQRLQLILRDKSSVYRPRGDV